MKEHTKKIEKYTFIAVLALLMTIVGVSVSVLAIVFSPTSNYITVQDYHAPDINFGDTTQEVLLLRTVRASYAGTYIDELNLVKTEDNTLQVVEIYKTQGSALYEKRNGQVKYLQYDLPENLEVGSYYWQSQITLDVKFGLKKSVTVKSNIFQVLPLE